MRRFLRPWGLVAALALLPLAWTAWAATAPGGRFGSTWAARGWPATWGSTPEQRATPAPASAWVPEANFRVWRGVAVAAPAELVAAWLAQLRFAPYSYDLIDNGGRRSPQVRSDDAPAMPPDALMGPFAIVETDGEGGFTILSPAAFSYTVACSYSVRALGPDRCRIEVTIVARVRTLLGALLLEFGDLAMMRRQLLNLSRLAEREASEPQPSGQAG